MVRHPWKSTSLPGTPLRILRWPGHLRGGLDNSSVPTISNSVDELHYCVLVGLSGFALLFLDDVIVFSGT